MFSLSDCSNITYTPDAVNDILRLPDEILSDFLGKIEELSFNVNLGKRLASKNGKDLSDCFKIYFDNARYRIVYIKKDGLIEVHGIEKTVRVAEIVGVGKRDREEIYNIVATRLGRLIPPISTTDNEKID